MSRVQNKAITLDEQDMRLDRWFHQHFPALGHGRLEKLLRKGEIRVDGRRAKANQRLTAGQNIRIPPIDDSVTVSPRAADVSPADAKLLQDAVLFKDDDVIAINKPPGLAVQGGSGVDRHLDGMLDALCFGKERPKLVHRLDKDTSGVLLLARSSKAARQLTAAFRDRSAEKIYWALVAGVPALRQGKIDMPLAKIAVTGGERMMADDDEGKSSVTYYQVIDTAGRKAAWLALMPLTGRTHQLRAHCAAIDTPVVGDGKYGGEKGFLTGAISRKLHLHARQIDIPHPAGGRIKVSAPLPPHMRTSFELFEFDERAGGDPFAELRQ